MALSEKPVPVSTSLKAASESQLPEMVSEVFSRSCSATIISAFYAITPIIFFNFWSSFS